MAWIRRVGATLALSIGSAFVLLAGGLVGNSIARGNEAWVLGVMLLPLAIPFLVGGWAVWRRGPLRPAIGLGTALASFGYGGIALGLTTRIAVEAGRTTAVWTGLGFIGLLLLWPLAILFTGIAGWLAAGVGRLSRAFLLGSAACWGGAWLAFWIFLFVNGGPSGSIHIAELVQDPAAWVVHGFFLLPALLALVTAWRVPRGR